MSFQRFCPPTDDTYFYDDDDYVPYRDGPSGLFHPPGLPFRGRRPDLFHDSYYCDDDDDYVSYRDGPPSLFHPPGLPFSGDRRQPPGFPFRGDRRQPPGFPFRGSRPVLPERGLSESVRIGQPLWSYKQEQDDIRIPQHPFDSRVIRNGPVERLKLLQDLSQKQIKLASLKAEKAKLVMGQRTGVVNSNLPRLIEIETALATLTEEVGRLLRATFNAPTNKKIDVPENTLAEKPPIMKQNPLVTEKSEGSAESQKARETLAQQEQVTSVVDVSCVKLEEVEGLLEASFCAPPNEKIDVPENTLAEKPPIMKQNPLVTEKSEGSAESQKARETLAQQEQVTSVVDVSCIKLEEVEGLLEASFCAPPDEKIDVPENTLAKKLPIMKQNPLVTEKSEGSAKSQKAKETLAQQEQVTSVVDVSCVKLEEVQGLFEASFCAPPDEKIDVPENTLAKKLPIMKQNPLVIDKSEGSAESQKAKGTLAQQEQGTSVVDVSCIKLEEVEILLEASFCAPPDEKIDVPENTLAEKPPIMKQNPLVIEKSEDSAESQKAKETLAQHEQVAPVVDVPNNRLDLPSANTNSGKLHERSSPAVDSAKKISDAGGRNGMAKPGSTQMTSGQCGDISLPTADTARASSSTKAGSLTEKSKDVANIGKRGSGKSYQRLIPSACGSGGYGGKNSAPSQAQVYPSGAGYGQNCTEPQGYPGVPQPGFTEPQGYPGVPQPGFTEPQGYPGVPQPGFTKPQGYPGVPQPGFTEPQGYPGVPQPGFTEPQGYPGVPQPGFTKPQGYPGVPQPGFTEPQGYPGVPQPSFTGPKGYQGVPQPGFTAPQGYQGVPQPGFPIIESQSPYGVNTQPQGVCHPPHPNADVGGLWYQGSGPPADGSYGGNNPWPQAPGYPPGAAQCHSYTGPQGYPGTPQPGFPSTWGQPSYGADIKPQGVHTPYPSYAGKVGDRAAVGQWGLPPTYNQSYDQHGRDSLGQASIDKTYSSFISIVGDRKSQATDDADRKHQRGYSKSSDKQRRSSSRDDRKSSPSGHPRDDRKSSPSGHPRDDRKSSPSGRPRDYRKSSPSGRHNDERKSFHHGGPCDDWKSSSRGRLHDDWKSSCRGRLRDDWKSSCRGRLLDDRKSSRDGHSCNGDGQKNTKQKDDGREAGTLARENMDALLQDDELKHILFTFAGISKETAKLEQLMKTTGEKDSLSCNGDEQKNTKQKDDGREAGTLARENMDALLQDDELKHILFTFAGISKETAKLEQLMKTTGEKDSHSCNGDGQKSTKQKDDNREAGKLAKENMDALLQDDELKHILFAFAGISKETAKLEQSLKTTEEKFENYATTEDSTSRHEAQPSAQKSVTPSERVRDEPKGFNSDDRKSTKAAAPLTAMLCSERKKVSSSGHISLKLPLKSGSAHVENLQVTSRTVHSDDDDDEPYMESRKVILPSKSDVRIVSQSPAFRKSQSPETNVPRKRPASPPLFPVSKERRDFSGKGSHSDLQSHLMMSLEKNTPEMCQALGLDTDSSYKSLLSQTLLGGLNVSGQPVVERAQSSVMRDHFNRDSVRKSPDRQTLRSPDRQKSRSPGRRLSRSPLRRQSRSPYRGKSKSSDRRKSISSSRSRSGSSDRWGSRSPDRRRSRSPDRHRSRSSGRRRSRLVKHHKSRRSAHLKGSRSHRARSRSRGRRRSKSSSQDRSRSPSQSRSRSTDRRRSRSPRGQPSRARSPERHGSHHFLIQRNLSTSLKLHIDDTIIRY